MKEDNVKEIKDKILKVIKDAESDNVSFQLIPEISKRDELRERLSICFHALQEIKTLLLELK